jgi:hypothetical protein
MSVFLVDLEAVETRYTGQWKTHVPNLLRKAGHDVTVISGPSDIPSATTPGAFLNFGGTNVYKANQVEQMGRMFTEGRVYSGDHFLFTDAWHPGIINLRYMSELLGIPVKIHALWHAGSYDPQDFLGRLIGDTPWVRHAEKSFYHAIDHNYFATEFHIEMFVKTLLGYENSSIVREFAPNKIIRAGWPMEYMIDTLVPYANRGKKDVILFPHRLAPEKQVEIFRDLSTALPEYEWIVCQEQQLSKEEYHQLLSKAKIVFSANLQETLGISMYEGIMVGAIPFVPDRLSYSEMFDEVWKYPSDWTMSWNSYIENKPKIIAKINELMSNYNDYVSVMPDQIYNLAVNYFSSTNLLKNLSGQ